MFRWRCMNVRSESCSILARLDYTIVNDIVDDGAVCVDCGQNHPLRCPPGILWGLVCGCRSLRRDHADIVEDLSEPAQCPLLVQPGRQYPLVFGLRLDL
jgi:hypothetical protein